MGCLHFYQECVNLAIHTKCLKGFKIIEKCLLEPAKVNRGKEDPDEIFSVLVDKVKAIFLVDNYRWARNTPSSRFHMIKDYRLTELVLFVCFFNVDQACPMHLAKLSYCFYV